ncbi:MAG: hypothetical protein ACLFST_00705 [Spirochaetia bacterium]
MKRRKFFFSFLLMLFAVQTGFSEEKDDLEDLINLLGKAFSISLEITVKEGDDEAVWTLDVSRITIIGRSVSVRLVGSNILIAANLTPYQDRNDEDTINLVVQWQTWLTSAGEGVVEYKPAMRTIPLDLGESAMFFPLGSEQENKNFDSFNIAIKLQVNPYIAKKDEQE